MIYKKDDLVLIEHKRYGDIHAFMLEDYDTSDLSKFWVFKDIYGNGFICSSSSIESVALISRCIDNVEGQ